MRVREDCNGKLELILEGWMVLKWEDFGGVATDQCT